MPDDRPQELFSDKPSAGDKRMLVRVAAPDGDLKRALLVARNLADEIQESILDIDVVYASSLAQAEPLLVTFERDFPPGLVDEARRIAAAGLGRAAAMASDAKKTPPGEPWLRCKTRATLASFSREG